MAGEKIDMPLIIGGKEVKTGACGRAVMPHDHAHVLGDYHKASEKHVLQAVEAAQKAQKEWSAWSFDDRAAVILKAAELLTTSWRDTINASTMLGQSKTAFQAEIDSACEIIDFWRFNVHYGQELLDEQPTSDHTAWNQLEYRALEGFVYAVTPFNFTSIAANLPTAPALMGNTVVWKPASSAMFAAHYLMKLYEVAGMPPGVINMVAGDAAMISKALLSHSHLAGVHFTGSTEVFNDMWKTIGASMGSYRSYPRIVGETGGKDFVVAHPSADVDARAVGIVRGGFEFQGQKCSAVSRAHIPRPIWAAVRRRMGRMIDDSRMGDIQYCGSWMGAVIDGGSFKTQKAAIDEAKAADGKAKVLVGGGYDDSDGWFVEPTVIEASDPAFRTMKEELFGPVVTAYVYDEKRYADTLDLIDAGAPYGLTGAVFSRDRAAVDLANDRLRYAAGNFYVNDKPTGAVVGQQPFGGGRASGTNDKAGSMWNLIRWVSPRTIKELFVPPTDYRYPYMGPEADAGR